MSVYEYLSQGQAAPAPWIWRWKNTSTVFWALRAAGKGKHVNILRASATKMGSQFEDGLQAMEPDSMEKVMEGFLGEGML